MSNAWIEIISRADAGTRQNIAPKRHWKVAIVIGKLNIFKNLEIKIIWKAQKKAPIITKESPNRTSILSSSLSNRPPTKHIIAAGQTDGCIFLENKKYAMIGTIITYKTVKMAELATSV